MWKRSKPTDDNPYGDEEVPPFPSEPRHGESGGEVISEEFFIPESERQAYLDAYYPFEDPPKLDERKYDLHSGKFFFVRDYKLIRKDGMNYICSPYYYESGGTIIDWMEPKDFESKDSENASPPRKRPKAK